MGARGICVIVFFFLTLCRSTPLQGRGPQLVSRFSVVNDRPIIGIAAQETAKGNPHGETYIPATYVKYLQQAGARVVPVRAGEPDDYYTDLFSKLNGVLFPGGGVSLTESQYARTGRILYNLTLQAFDGSGEVFPLWGTCLGFELLNTITAGKNLLQKTDAENITLPLDFAPGFRHSRMMGQIPQDVLNYLTNEPVTQNEHQYGMLVDVFDKTTALRKFYRILSTNVGRKGKKFVSTFEAFRYPIYGVQWHPEKNAFNWNPHYVINHSEHAVRVAQHFANFLVGEARKSSHRFPSVEAETAALIDNFNPVFFTDGTFYQNYYFNFTQSAVQNMKAFGKFM
ncbi:gamma-glutamyl hydrolase-like [Babylonia areolata]|uniref:gamma-glutamyl hydrolase-like n=1 Tax=Babylonia areolata TaxID=304850 RepID=UPI003FCF7BCE